MKTEPKGGRRSSLKRLAAALVALGVAGGAVAALTAVLSLPVVHSALIVSPSTPDPIDPPGA